MNDCGISAVVSSSSEPFFSVFESRSRVEPLEFKICPLYSFLYDMDQYWEDLILRIHPSFHRLLSTLYK